MTRKSYRRIGLITAVALAVAVAATYAVISSTPKTLQFGGMNTVFGLSKLDKSGLLRQPDCSLTQYGFSWSTRALIPASGFQDTLHQLAGLTTKPDLFAAGCKDPVLGVASTHAAYFGKTAAGMYVGAQGATDHEPDLVVYGINPTTLTFTTTTLATGVYPQVLGVDLNKDGNIDLIAAGVTDPATQKKGIAVFLGNGDGTFRAGTVYDVNPTPSQSFIVDDLNGDGIADILVPNPSASGGTQLTALIGKGDGTFTIGPSTPIALGSLYTLLGVSQPIATGDFNGDGKVDVLTADGMLYPGRGDGSFGAGTQALPTGYWVPTAFAIGDFNGDGKLDVAELVSGLDESGTVMTFLGHGDGTFTTGADYDSVPEGTAMVATDLDGDGHLDLFVGRESNGLFGAAGLGNQSLANTWYYQALMGHGDGTFSGPPATVAAFRGISVGGANSAGAESYALADFNKDGHIDALAPTASRNGLAMLPGAGDGSFGAAIISPTTLSAFGVAAADLDGDGNADAVVLGYTPAGAAGVGVLYGAGDGSLGGEVDYPLPGAGSAIQIGDFNGDGRPDIAVAVNCQTPCVSGVYVLFGQPSRAFSAPALLRSTPALSDAGPQTYLAAGDLNGDGIADLVAVDSGFLSGNGLTTPGTVHVYLGQSNGTFIASSPAVPPLYFSDAALADMNGDGHLDLITAASDPGANTQVDVFTGHGDGGFATAIQTPIAGGVADPAPLIAVADFDGDGHPDVAFFLSGAFGGVLFGAGDGTLPTQVDMPVFSPVSPTAPKAADLNGDGRADLMFVDGDLPRLVSMINEWGASTGGVTATQTALAVTPNPATVGQAVVLTATVTGATGTPVGSVAFLDGTATLGTAALNAQGVATLSLATLAAGSHSLSAQYEGNANFAASTSPVTDLTVNAGAVDFSIAASSASGSVSAGAAAGTSLVLTPINGFSGTVSLACSGLPAGASCQFSPASPSLSGTAVTAQLSISTSAPVVARVSAPRDPFGPASPRIVLGVILTPIVVRAGRHRRLGARWRRLGLLLFCVLALQACHGGSSAAGGSRMGGTPAGTYALTITATAGSISHSVQYQLTVTA